MLNVTIKLLDENVPNLVLLILPNITTEVLELNVPNLKGALTCFHNNILQQHRFTFSEECCLKKKDFFLVL